MSAQTLEIEAPAEKTSVALYYHYRDLFGATQDVPQARKAPVHIVALPTSHGRDTTSDLLDVDITPAWLDTAKIQTTVPTGGVHAIYEIVDIGGNIGSNIFPNVGGASSFLEKLDTKSLWTTWQNRGFFSGVLFASKLAICGFWEQSPWRGVVSLTLSAQWTSTTENAGVITLSTATIQPMSLEVRRRLRGHEHLVQTICALTRYQAAVRGLMLRTIGLRPAWSHESDEQTGIVIDIEVKATVDDRCAYVDAVCEQIHQLEASLSPEDQHFLNDEIFLIVSRS